jgi:predicted alpha/beta-hydrolase family hydrolase
MAVGARTFWSIKAGAVDTTAVFDPATSRQSGVVLVLAHAAGGHMDHPTTLALTDEFRSRGTHVVRFNFPFREKGRDYPDPMPLLLETYAAVAARTRAETNTDILLLGGYSLGGRTASLLAARGYPAEGLVLLAYPLHPAGQSERLRYEHLSSIQQPTLCLNGTRDPHCDRALMDGILEYELGETWTLHWLEDADHSFHVAEFSKRTDADVLDEIGRVSDNWIARF